MIRLFYVVAYISFEVETIYQAILKFLKKISPNFS